MSTTSPADETSSEASTSTRTPTEEAGDDAASDAVGDAETTTQVTKAPTVAARRASTVTFEPRQCRETVGETSPTGRREDVVSGSYAVAGHQGRIPFNFISIAVFIAIISTE